MRHERNPKGIDPRKIMGKLTKILVVDDEPNIRIVFRTALESEDYQVATAADGETALRWLGQFPTDLVLLDLAMPGLGGMEVLSRLREAGNAVPVVIVTAQGTIPDAVAAMRLGAIDFLAKPLTPDGLRKMVRSVIERQTVADPDLDGAPGERRGSNLLASAKRAINHRLFDRASVLLHEVIKENPRSAEPWYLMGVLHEARDRPRTAIKDYKSALELEPDHAYARARFDELVMKRL
jgi:DNA-binding response OmpR family regulator